MDNQQNNVAYNRLLNYVNGNVFQFNLEEQPNRRVSRNYRRTSNISR